MNKLDVLKETTVKLERGGYSCTAVVLLQKNPPHDLLIGTDLLPLLGFQFIQKTVNSKIAVDMFSHKECNVGEVKEKVGESPKQDLVNSSLEVKLISAVRVPAQHEKLIKAKVCKKSLDGKVAVFEMDSNFAKDSCVTIDEALVKSSSDNDVTLVLRNSGFHPVCLEEGRVLGTLQEATLLSLKDDMSWLGEEYPTVIRALHAASSKTKNNHKVLLDTLHWKTDSLSEDEAMKLKELLSEYQDVFALNNSELSSTNLVHHHIATGDVKPIHQHARRIPFALREKVDEMVQDMLDQGVIQHSHSPWASPWASPIVLVAKRDGTTRFCEDYRRLNSVTKMDVFPLPRIDDSIDILSHSWYFSTLDLRSEYWQVKMASKSIEKTAFATHSRLYEFVVMPFGLCNAPSTFQWLMERVLTGLARDVCIVYLDDILVMGTTLKEHLFNHRCVFDHLRNAGLRLKPSKCYLARREVEYLGYVISDRGVAADPKAVQEFPTPTNRTQTEIVSWISLVLQKIYL